MHYFGGGLIKLFKSYDEFLTKRNPQLGDANTFPPLGDEDFAVMFRTFVERRLALVIDPAKPRLRFIGEKDPGHAFQLMLLGSLFPKAKFIHVLRDGRDLALSSWAHNQRTKDNKQLRDMPFDKLLEGTAQDWVKKFRPPGNKAAN